MPGAAHAHAQPQSPLPGARELRRQDDPHARFGEGRGGVGEECPCLGGVEEDRLGPCFAQTSLDGCEEPRGHGQRAEQVFLCGVKGMPQATQGVPVPAEHLARRHEEAGVVGSLEEEAEREGVCA